MDRMNIRSITVFLNPGWPVDREALKAAGRFVEAAKRGYEEEGYTVQTTRLASISFVELLGDPRAERALELAKELETAAKEMGFDYVSLGPVPLGNVEAYERIPEILGDTEIVFVSGMIAAGERVSLEAIRRCASVIRRASTITPDGFANLRFGALANVPPGGPFFPGAYHQGEEPAFSIATESADLAVEAFSGEGSLEAAADRLVGRVEAEAHRLEAVAGRLWIETGYHFNGIDFSLAPFPERDRSLGEALERLGAAGAGLHGSLAAAAFLAATLDRAHFTRTGYCGMMMPVLEDAVLAQRAGEGVLDVMSTLMYSAVCGVGLVTVPVPGDTSEEELAAVLLDLAALSCRLNKPLAARLMPVPGKRAGDETEFDFGYFANSRVMPVRAKGLEGYLAREGELRVGMKQW
jgi:uncharacterized protein (UPF0210 family)